jgi:nucleoside-diphosphate-sugar epimerase
VKAFVAGATGLTGRFVVEALCEQGLEVIAHVRPDSSRIEEWTRRFSEIGAQVDTTEWSQAAMDERFSQAAPDLVFSLLGTTKKREKKGGGDYQSVDFGLTAMLINAVKSSPSTRFVYLSSIGTKKGVSSAYLKARWMAEEHLSQSELPYLVARPSLILGDRDESRLLESVGGGISDVLIGAAGLLGARKFAKRVGSIQGSELGEGLVREALLWPKNNRILYSDDLRKSAAVEGKVTQ